MLFTVLQSAVGLAPAKKLDEVYKMIHFYDNYGAFKL